MGMVRVRVSDISGSRINEVEAPDDVAVSRILVVLIERMNLPLNSPDGQLMSYKLHHRRTGSQLLDSQTFGQANVVEGDELRLQPEITAGAAGRCASVLSRRDGISQPRVARHELPGMCGPTMPPTLKGLQRNLPSDESATLMEL
jgi:hypothetical protein